MKQTAEIQKRTAYPGIDLVRFLCAMLVVSAHVYPFGNNGNPLLAEMNFWTQNWLARIGVPFFFVCTGFFLFRNSEPGTFPRDKVRHNLKKLLRLYLLWTLLYSPLILKEVILIHPDGLGSGIGKALRTFFLSGSYIHLWYLHGAVTAVAIVGWLGSRGCRFSRMLPVAGILFLIGVLPQAYLGILLRIRERIPAVWTVWEIYEKIFYSTRNGLFEGFLYVALGGWLAQRNCRLSLKASAAGFAVSLGLLFAELYLCRKLRLLGGADLCVCHVPTVFFLFCMASQLNLKGRFWPHLRTLANITYFIHVWVYKLLVILFAIADWDLTVPCVYYLTTTACTLLLAEALIRLSKHPKLSFLKILYN